MSGDRLFFVRAVLDRVEALLQSVVVSERLVLPGDELRVTLVVRRELPPPVDREAERLHPPLVVFVDEVPGESHRRLQRFEGVFGDVIRVPQDRELFLLAALQALDRADDRRPRDVPRDGKEDVVSPLATVSGVHVRDGVGARVTDVHPAARIRVRYGDERRLFGTVRVGLVPPRLGPAFPPAPFDGLRVVLVHTVFVVGEAKKGYSGNRFLTRIAIGTFGVNVFQSFPFVAYFKNGRLNPPTT